MRRMFDFSICTSSSPSSEESGFASRCTSLRKCRCTATASVRLASSWPMTQLCSTSCNSLGLGTSSRVLGGSLTPKGDESSVMMVWHRSTHSLQMQTPGGPAISLATSLALLPQKLQRSPCSGGPPVVSDPESCFSSDICCALSYDTSATGLRVSITWSTRPYSLASCADMKKSQCESSSICFGPLPAWRPRISQRTSLLRLISLA